MSTLMDQLLADLRTPAGKYVRLILACGSRNWRDGPTIRETLAQYMPTEVWAEPPTIMHGGCRGADKLIGEHAMWLGFWVEEHPANWKALGKAAGPIRNRMMLARKPELVLAFGEGKGTQDTVDEARRLGIPVRRILSEHPSPDAASASTASCKPKDQSGVPDGEGQ